MPKYPMNARALRMRPFHPDAAATVHLHRGGGARERGAAQPGHPDLPDAHGQVAPREPDAFPGEVPARAHPRGGNLHRQPTGKDDLMNWILFILFQFEIERYFIQLLIA